MVVSCLPVESANSIWPLLEKEGAANSSVRGGEGQRQTHAWETCRYNSSSIVTEVSLSNIGNHTEAYCVHMKS